MATYHPRPRHVPGFRVGLFIFAFCSLSAQELVISVGSRVAQGCGSALAASAIQRDVEAHLGLAGFRLAKAHSASLESDIDCVAVGSRARTTGIAVHQCLALSQLVTLPSQARGALATTWRRCQSYTCAHGECGASLLAAERDLVRVFISEFRARPQTETEPAVARAAPFAQRAASSLSLGAKVIYYGFYIVACCALLLRWEWRKH